MGIYMESQRMINIVYIIRLRLQKCILEELKFSKI